MAADQDIAIADLKMQFEGVVAQWRDAGDAWEPVRVQTPSDGRWLLAVHTPSFVSYRLTPPRSLWLATWEISTKVPELSLVGAAYEDEHRLIVVAEWKRPVILLDDNLLLSWAKWLSLPPSEEPSDLFVDPVRQIAARRSFRALVRILLTADRAAIEEAASQSSDIGVVLRALEQPEAIEALASEDPFTEAALKGVRERERLLSEEGGTWNVEDVAKHLQLTRQAINRRRKLGTLLGLDAGRHGFRYPAWQFTRQGTISGLEQVLAALKHLDPLMQQAFMLGQSARLENRRAVDVLRKGDIAAVVDAASAFGEHGAP